MTRTVDSVRSTSYPNQLSDEQWNLLEPVFNAPGKRGRKHTDHLHSVVDAMLYIAETGSQWRHLTVGERRFMDIAIEQYTGSHRDLDWSFREADDSQELLDAYIDLGQLWVARAAGGEVIGHLQVVPRDEEVWEVTNTAVVESRRGRGVGRALLERAVERARAAGVRRLILATGAADVGNLRFYQRCGFRMTRVVQDVFTPENGYPPGLEVDGIPLLDQVWFERVL